MSLLSIASLGHAFLNEAAATAAEAAEHGAAHAEHAEAGVNPKAVEILGPMTNSILVALIVCVTIIWFVRSALSKKALIPGKKQNFVEMLVEFLYNQVENIVGPKQAPMAFPLLGTIFIFTLVANYFGLLPGVGTIGYAKEVGAGFSAQSHIEAPLLRPATADINMTAAMAVFAIGFWAFLTLKEIGVKGFIDHTFGAKGGVSGKMKACLMPLFIMVGFIELFSMAFRPVSLSLRLYGNNYAGESLVHVMTELVKTGNAAIDFLAGVVLPLPFYFFELLVGVVQALVFTLLVAVYIQLTTTHDEHHEEEGHGASTH
jgi:F-type H+-transporting ATPase subunit a